MSFKEWELNISMDYASLKKPAALILSLLCLAFAACSAPAEPTASPGASSPGGKVYAEEAVDISQFQFVQNIRTIKDGALTGIGTDLGTGQATLFKLGDDGAPEKSVPLPLVEGQTINVIYALDDDGGVYIHEANIPALSSAVAARTEAPPPPNDALPVLRHIDADGKELETVELQTPPAAPGASTDMYSSLVYNLGVDAEAGRVYENTQSQIRIYDLSTGEHLKTIKNQTGGMDNFVVMDAGNVYDPYMERYIDNQFSQADADILEAKMSQADTMLSYDTTMLDLALEELDPFLKGQKSAQDTAKTLQSRLSMYLSEQA